MQERSNFTYSLPGSPLAKVADRKGGSTETVAARSDTLLGAENQEYRLAVGAAGVLGGKEHCNLQAFIHGRRAGRVGFLSPSHALPCSGTSKRVGNAGAAEQPTSAITMVRSLLISMALLLAFAASGQTSSERAAVRLTASVQPATPSITLNWVPIIVHHLPQVEVRHELGVGHRFTGRLRDFLDG